jgi:hypothetical protein
MAASRPVTVSVEVEIDLSIDGVKVTDARRLTLRPGTALVIRFDRDPDMAEADEIQRRVRSVLGVHVPILILGPAADIEVIEAPQPDGT